MLILGDDKVDDPISGLFGTISELFLPALTFTWSGAHGRAWWTGQGRRGRGNMGKASISWPRKNEIVEDLLLKKNMETRFELEDR